MRLPGHTAGPTAASTHGPPMLWAVLAVVAVVLTVMVWREPTTRTHTLQRPITVGLEFDYSAQTTPGDPIHAGRDLRFGDPVFLALVDAVEVTVRVPEPAPGVGIATLDVETRLESAAGWSRSMSDPIRVELGRSAAEVPIRIDFAGALRIAERIETATGVAGTLGVVVLATVTLQPGGAATARLEFDLNHKRAHVLGPGPGDGDSAASGQRLLTWNVPEQVQRSAELALGPISLTVVTARSVASIAALAAVAVALASAAAALRARRRGEGPWLVARHAGHLVDVGDGFVVPDDVIDLASFDGLVSVGSGAQQRVMVDARDTDVGVDFYVIDGANIYRYRAGASVRA
jgi:hypothetical protein